MSTFPMTAHRTGNAHPSRLARVLAVVAILFLAAAVWAQSAADGYAPVVNGNIHAVVVRADGKAVIGGDFGGLPGQAVPQSRRGNRQRVTTSVP